MGQRNAEGKSYGLLQEDPEVIRIFSRDEYKQFELQNEVKRNTKLSYWRSFID